MEKNNAKGWLYLLPAILFLGVFMIYPLIDVFVYSFEEGYNSASQTFFGVGLYNYSYVLHDPYFLQALKNTFLLVIITVPLSTGHCPAHIRRVKLNQKASQSFPDRIFSALRHKYPGGGIGIHDTLQEDCLYGRPC